MTELRGCLRIPGAIPETMPSVDAHFATGPVTASAFARRSPMPSPAEALFNCVLPKVANEDFTPLEKVSLADLKTAGNDTKSRCRIDGN